MNTVLVDNCIMKNGKMVCWEKTDEGYELVTLTKERTALSSLSKEEMDLMEGLLRTIEKSKR